MSQDSSNQVSVNQDPVNREKGSDAYKNQVELKYQLYNSLFLTLLKLRMH